MTSSLNAQLPSGSLPISLEFFPAKTQEGMEKIRQVRHELYPLKPEFCSVTYGAGGSTQDGTFTAVGEILIEGVAAASHLTCVGATKATVRRELRVLTDMGCKRLVVLRGDLPGGYGSDGDFTHAHELVEFLRDERGDYFWIEVAAYPEIHPRARTPDHDLHAFAIKAKSGANSAITQYFFNADAYFRFIEDCLRLGVSIPIVPGIMPITNATQLLRFSDMCGAEIPRWIRLRLNAYGEDLPSIKAFGLDVMTDLCERLLAHGVPALHFYTMNQSGPVLELCKRLKLGGGR
jgi:methylenetetrahydrofolate reductase (NADPH)